jgi:hypothetical protein
MFITGPDVVKAVTHEEVTFEELGGADVHSEISGVCHLASDSEPDALYLIRKLLSYIPQNNMEDPPFLTLDDDPRRMDERLNKIIPEDPSKPYDIKDAIRMVVDGSIFFEIQEAYAQNIVIGFARLGGHSVGIVANQPMVLAACWISSHLKRVLALCVFAMHSIFQSYIRGRPRVPPGTAQNMAASYVRVQIVTLCLLRSYGTEDYRDHPQSLRRRLRRDEQQACEG